ncbi:MAG: NupC/NupG family nucleoside CNT transporter [Planctomycetota bacterium]|nr:MAG: NupC/NupG family nucleoside CNT transporter [Planctomycetota bacterium]
MPQYQGLIGLVVLLLIAWLLSENRQRIVWRPVLMGLGLQVVFALLILKTPYGEPMFQWCGAQFGKLIAFSDRGADFVFAQFGQKTVEGPLLNIAFRILPTVIFFSALLSVLYHLGIMQRIVQAIAWVMVKTMGTSGAESLSCAANIFVGQTEAPLLIKPFMPRLTRSELMTVMQGGFATIAGGVMAVYVSMLKPILGERVAGDLMAASVMAAPAALLISKIMLPETAIPDTRGTLRIPVERTASNVIQAYSDGALDGLKLALNMGALLIAFVAAIELLNALLGWGPTIPLIGPIPTTSLQAILGWLFRPIAWALGVTWDEAAIVGRLLGEKLVLTEMMAYIHLTEVPILPTNDPVAGSLTPRAARITAYALCGFANMASIGIQIGGLGAMAENRRAEIAGLAFKAMLGGAMATGMTAAIAGIML